MPSIEGGYPPRPAAPLAPGAPLLSGLSPAQRVLHSIDYRVHGRHVSRLDEESIQAAVARIRETKQTHTEIIPERPSAWRGSVDNDPLTRELALQEKYFGPKKLIRERFRQLKRIVTLETVRRNRNERRAAFAEAVMPFLEAEDAGVLRF